MRILSSLSLVCAFGSAFLLNTLPGEAQAQAMVIGENDAYRCYMKIKTSPKTRNSTVKLCEQALEDILSSQDRASTYVNLGIAQMRLKRYEDAKNSYDEAITLRPELSEAYINRAASHIYQMQYSQALADIEKAIDLGTEKMPEALFNRAMCYDAQEKYQLAYRDLKAALKLKPDWEPALRAIDRYVVSKGS